MQVSVYPNRQTSKITAFALPSLLIPTAQGASVSEGSEEQSYDTATNVAPVLVHSLSTSLPSEIDFALRTDVSGYQTRQKLLRASLSTLDGIKGRVKPPRTRIQEFVHDMSEKTVGRIKNDRKEIFSYMSDPRSDNALEDKFYLMACQPGLRESDSLSVLNHTAISDFRESLMSVLDDVVNAEQTEESRLLTTDKTILQSDTENDSNAFPIVDSACVDNISSTDIAHAYVSLPAVPLMLSDDDSINSKFFQVVKQPIPVKVYSPGEPYSKTSLIKSPTSEVMKSFPQEPPYKSISGLLPDKRQINVPPPFYRETFGILGGKKQIEINPRIISSTNPIPVGSSKGDTNRNNRNNKNIK